MTYEMHLSTILHVNEAAPDFDQTDYDKKGTWPGST